MAIQVILSIKVGIGKSAAFSALVHNLNKGDDQTHNALKNTFTFLKSFKHFIFLNGKYIFSEINKQERSLILEDISKNR